MTKLRHALTHANAVTIIAKRIGKNVAAAAVGKTVRTIDYWCDPDHAKCPTTCEAVLLDAAWIASGGHGAPMMEAHSAILTASCNHQIACRGLLAEVCADANEEFGEAMSANFMVLATLDGTPCVAAVSHAIKQTEEAHSATGRVLALVSSFQSTGGLRAGGAQQ